MTPNKIVAERKSAAEALCAYALLAAAGFGAVANPEEGHAQQALEEIVVTAERRELNLQDVADCRDGVLRRGPCDQGHRHDSRRAAGRAERDDHDVQPLHVHQHPRCRSRQSAPTSNPGVAYYVDGMFIPHEQFICAVVLRHRIHRSACAVRRAR